MKQRSEYNKKEADSDIQNKLVITMVGEGWGNRRHKLLAVR